MRSGTKEITRGRIYREALGIIVLALAVFVLLALVSYDPVERGGVLEDAAAGDLDAVYRVTTSSAPASDAPPPETCAARSVDSSRPVSSGESEPPRTSSSASSPSGPSHCSSRGDSTPRRSG